MSRIGKLPINVPAGVTVTVGKDNAVTIKGPKGEMKQIIEGDMKIEINDGELTIERPNESKESRSMHGLSDCSELVKKYKFLYNFLRNSLLLFESLLNA